METLKEWLEAQIGPEKRHKTPRMLSLDAGLNQGVVGLLLAGSRKPEPETLVKLARATHANPAFLFRLAGWLTDEDLGPKVLDALRPRDEGERDLLLGFRQLPPQAQRMIVGGIQAGLRSLADQETRPEESAPRRVGRA